MKILVLQIATDADFLLSVPAFNALKRQGEVHLLVTPHLREIAGMIAGVHLHIINEEDPAPKSLIPLLLPIKQMNFDRVINLTCSALTSVMTEILSSPGAQVSGYTRHADGHLHIPDDASAYRHAQVGRGRHNQYHMADVYAAIAGVELEDRDFDLDASRAATREKRILVHLQGRAPGELWSHVVQDIEAWNSHEVHLIGLNDQRGLADAISLLAPGVRNRVGSLCAAQLWKELTAAELVLSAPDPKEDLVIAMSSLAQTPVLWLGTEASEIFERGPLSVGSRAICTPRLLDLSPQRVVGEAQALLCAERPLGPCAERVSLCKPYLLRGWELNDSPWKLVEAMYTGTPYPPLPGLEDKLALQRVFEIADLALEQLDRWKDSRHKSSLVGILASVDELLTEVCARNTYAAIVIRWFETQRLRLPPADADATLACTRQLFEELLWVAAVYRDFADPASEAKQASDLCVSCAARLREHELADVQPEFQTLLSKLHELARHSTKVAGQSWSSVLKTLNSAMERQDFIEVADQLEHVLAPALGQDSADETC
ncbi:MAG: glycosyltransferase family 9 protein [Bdellovibrionales bacterium]